MVAYYLQRLVWRVQSWFGQSTIATRDLNPGAPKITGWDLIETSYRTIAHRAQRRDVPVLLLIFPTRPWVEAQTPPLRVRQLTTLAQDLSWTVVDLSSAFQGDTESLFLPDDPVHPSAQGYERAAQHIARELIHSQGARTCHHTSTRSRPGAVRASRTSRKRPGRSIPKSRAALPPKINWRSFSVRKPQCRRM